MKKKWIGLLVLVGILSGTVFAEKTLPEMTPESENGGWEFAVAPYLWMAGIEGSAGTLPGLPVADVDADFSDILENLDFTLMVAGEARNGKWAVMDDFIYLNLSAGAHVPAPVSAKAEADIVNMINTLAAAYRVVEEEKITVDVYAGARLWYVDTELAIKGGPAAGKTQGDDLWIDPVCGVKMLAELGGNFSLMAGGFFGMGASDEDWSLMSTLNYTVNDLIRVMGGYRHMSVDYEDGGFVYDVELSGPILGLAFRF